jgi:hypothetical protein
MKTLLSPVTGTSLSANVAPLSANIYDRAMRIALSADNDWGRQLAAARTLSESPDSRHQNLARHIRDAHALYEAGLLNPANQDIPPEIDGRDTVTVATYLPCDQEPFTIRRVLATTAAVVAGVWLGLASVMIW